MSKRAHLLQASAIAIASVLAVSSSTSAADRALLVGVGSYKSLPPELFLDGPPNDVRELKQVVINQLGYTEENIKILTDAEATRENILATFDDWLVAGTKEGDRAYFYFSGHGVQVKDKNGDEEDDRDEALAGYDVVANEDDWSNVVLDDDLDAASEKLAGRDITFVVDACHSGTITRSLSPLVAQPIKGARFLPHPRALPVEEAKTRGIRIDVAGAVDKPKVVTNSWTAAMATQLAWDDDRLPQDKRHGVFTKAYIDGLITGKADASGNGIISNSELYEYIKVQSEEYCKGKSECPGLSPQYNAPEAAYGASAIYVNGGAYAPPKDKVIEIKVEPKPEVTYAEPVKEEVAVYVDPPKKPEVVYVEPEKKAAPDYVEPVYVAPTYQDKDPVAAVYDIAGKANDGVVKVELLPSPQLKPGQAFHIRVTSAKPGFLILLDVNSKGEAVQIFPNDFAQKITPLSAGRPLTIPDEYYGFDFEADGNGKSVLVAIVVSDPVDLTKVAPKSRGLQAVEDARGTLTKVVAPLKAPWVEDKENRSVRWDIGTVEYTIY